MSRQPKPLCEGYIAAMEHADRHTQSVWAYEAAVLAQDYIDGTIDWIEFLMCCTIDEPVNK